MRDHSNRSALDLNEDEDEDEDDEGWGDDIDEVNRMEEVDWTTKNESIV